MKNTSPKNSPVIMKLDLAFRAVVEVQSSLNAWKAFSSAIECELIQLCDRYVDSPKGDSLNSVLFNLNSLAPVIIDHCNGMLNEVSKLISSAHFAAQQATPFTEESADGLFTCLHELEQRLHAIPGVFDGIAAQINRLPEDESLNRFGFNLHQGSKVLEGQTEESLGSLFQICRNLSPGTPADAPRGQRARFVPLIDPPSDAEVNAARAVLVDCKFSAIVQRTGEIDELLTEVMDLSPASVQTAVERMIDTFQEFFGAQQEFRALFVANARSTSDKPNAAA